MTAVVALDLMKLTVIVGLIPTLSLPPLVNQLRRITGLLTTQMILILKPIMRRAPARRLNLFRLTLWLVAAMLLSRLMQHPSHQVLMLMVGQLSPQASFDVRLLQLSTDQQSINLLQPFRYILCSIFSSLCGVM
jgi:hypothetical protein